MKPFNCEETIVYILVKTHLKMKLPPNYVCKQMTDVQFLL